MLILHSISSPSGQREVFKDFDPSRSTWIVSDLKSKLDLNRHLLKSREFIPGESVLRASELWKTLLTRLRPDLQIVSREFMITLLAHKLAATEHDWAKAPGAAQASYEYLTQLMPILAHPDGVEIMSEWFKDNTASEARWGRWFQLSVHLWSELLQDGFVAPTWASGVLANEPTLADVWSRPLIVDLGAEIDAVEADLLVQLSSALDITVLRPEPSWAAEYGKALSAYEILERKLSVAKIEKVAKVRSEGVARPSSPPLYRKYTTMIAEVKDAVAQAREWLEDGTVTAAEIAIVAPDIEAYWPSLSSYLDHEGISSQKDRVRRLHTFPDVARWLASLRLRTGSFAEPDVELALFETDTPRLIGFERFKTLYSTLYGREDFDRSEAVAKKFAIELRPTEEVLRDDFIAWSLKQLPENVELSRIELIFKRIFAECPQAMRLTVKRWLTYLEQVAARVECRTADGDPDGIACINLSSAENSPAARMVVLGLTESALKPTGGTAILVADIMSLAAKFGFHLASDDQSCLEFEARWVIEDDFRELLLAVPETDFAGAAQAPSWLWLKGARATGQSEWLAVPRTTRWDELQSAPLNTIAHEKHWHPAHTEFLERALQEDLGETYPEPFGAGLIETLSPSAIEDYLECPFIFAAKRLFALSDIAELDLEVDASRRGNLMHKLFEFLTKEPMRFDLSDEEIAKVVEDAREAAKLELADARLWPPLKARHIEMARRFLTFEKDNRRLFPKTTVVAREADIAGFLKIETGELIRQHEPGSLKFVGRIDRIDHDGEGHYAIFDYKSSAASVSQFGTWLKNNQIQLLLYAMAVEKGLSVFEPREVVGALYYVARPMNRDYGFKVEDAEQKLFDVSDKRKRNRISRSDKEKLFTEARTLVKRAVDGILAGRFGPEPRDAKGCTECQWSPLCRAPHLST